MVLHIQLLYEFFAVNGTKELRSSAAEHFRNGVHIEVIKVRMGTDDNVKFQIRRGKQFRQQPFEALMPFDSLDAFREIKVD